jgi:type I restriction enzyme, R subunit
MYDDELKFEHDLVESLKQHGWKDGVLNHPTEQDLIDNWANIIFQNNNTIDRLNDCPLTRTEMQQIIDQITLLKTPLKINGFINGRTVSIKRDNPDDIQHKGKEISLKIFDRDEIAGGQSRYQIAEQPIFNKKSPILNDRRGDILLLLYGMPLIHVELKKSNVSIKQATNQIEKYSHEGIFKNGIFQLVQIFVAMTPEEMLYFANPGSDGIFNPKFYFHWENFNNEIINDWREVVKSFLYIPMAHQLISKYSVADDTDGVLKVMRSYQYHAVNRITDVVSKTNDWMNPNIRGGYIWHTTGSGKTLTSFKAAQLISLSKDADKVVFLMDRIELGTQSLLEYQGFADDKDDVQGTENTKELITKLKSDDPRNTLIVTSIQKMSTIKDYIQDYEYDISLINKKRMVIIVDECHRNVFGEMMSSIKETFPRALYFGFTGTPIMDINSKKMSVTTDVFGDELQRYVIADGIRDGNVLGFDKYKVLTFKDSDLKKVVALERTKSQTVEDAISNDEKADKYYDIVNNMPMAGYEDDNGNYIKGVEDYLKPAQYKNEKHRNSVVDNIIENWNSISRNNEYSALFATSSIPEAIQYYRLFKEKGACNFFNITVLVDPNIDNTEGFEFKEDGLVEIISDYNKMFDKSFSLSTSAYFKKDLSLRLAHKKPYNRISKKDQIDLLIVVDQMLTGFDSKWINALYLDKVLEYENIIQAFSRTNRVHNEHKPFGMIKYYRKPYTMEKNIEKAIAAYSGDKPFQIFVPKLKENIEKMNIIFDEIKELFSREGINNFEKLPEDKAVKKKFVKLYNEFNKYLEAAKVQGYVPKNNNNDSSAVELKGTLDYSSVNDEMISDENIVLELNSPISQEELDALNQRYIEVGKSNKGTNDDYAYDIESYLIEIDDGKIDSSYMNSRFKKYLKMLDQENISPEELENSLKELHKSFASLSQEQQKYANIFLHDIESGNIQIDSSKTFMDYITEYASNAANDQIRKISNTLGLDEVKLRNIMKTSVNSNNLNEFGRFESLVNSVDINKAKDFFEKLLNKQLSTFEVNMEVSELLTVFILSDGIDLDEYKG